MEKNTKLVKILDNPATWVVCDKDFIPTQDWINKKLKVLGLDKKMDAYVASNIENHKYVSRVGIEPVSIAPLRQRLTNSY